MHGRTPLEPLGQAGSLTGSKLYLADYPAKDPWWKSYLSIDRRIEHQAKGAILFLSAGGRNFAVTFGHVAHYLKDWKYEYDFGLIVTLNSVSPELLKSADIVRPLNARRQRIQSAKDSKLDVFGIDFNESVVKKLSGKVGDNYVNLFSSVTGANNVRISTKVELSELPELCEELIHLYKSKSYQTVFPELRNIAPVLDPGVRTELDNKLLTSLKAHDETMILSLPDLIDYHDVGGIKFSGGTRYSLIVIESLWDSYGEKLQTMTVDMLHSHHISVLDENSEIRTAYSLYKCLIWDCSIGNELYHFCDGLWYRIDKSFSERLITDLDSLFVLSDLPAHNGLDEGEYNENVPAIDGQYICLDRKFIVMAGQSPIEFCDLYRVTEGKSELTHVKIGVCSSVLSHLFNQGLVSANLLLNESIAKEKLKEFIEKNDQYIKPNTNHEKWSEYQHDSLVYALFHFG